jgi:molybdate transport system ATP-binding protein
MTWEIDLLRVLRHGQSRFDVSVRFASDAPRLVLHGPSGAGKTQTLKMIAGISRPDRGRVAVAGRSLFDSAAGLRLSPQQRQLGYVFKDYALFPHLSVRQNIAFGRLGGWLNPSRTLGDAAVDRWIATFHLESVVGHYPHQLSGGQRQRTALARALVNDPTALLLDEPFAALDNSLRQRLRLELKDLQAQLRIPMLLVTHDDEDIRLLADDVVHLRAGQVVDGAGVAAATEAQA